MVMKNLIIQFQNRAGRQTCKLKMCLVLNVIVSTNGVQHETLCVHVICPPSLVRPYPTALLVPP